MYKKSLNKKSLKKKLSRKQTGGGTNPFPFTLRQLTGTKTPYSSYMPVDPNQRGSAMFALGTLGEAAGNLFGGKDRDGDGLMDGAFRDLRAKRRRFKDNKGFGFTYKDQQGNPVVGDPRELYKASKDPNYTPRSPQQMMQDYQTYSRFGTDDQGRLQSFITDRPFDKRDFTNKGRLRNFIQENVNSGKPLMPKFFNEVTTPEEAYQQMQPASEFDFSPFMPKQKTRTVTRTVTKPASGSGSTAVNTQTDKNASAVINGVTYTASDPVANTATTPDVTNTQTATNTNVPQFMSVKPKDTPKFDFQGGDVYTNPAVSSAQRANLNNALNLTDFNEVQKVLEQNIGMISGGKAAATPQPAGTFELFDSDKILANKGMMRTGKPKMGIKRMFPELANNDELFNSPQAELLRMYNVNASFDPRVAVAIAQGLIPSDDRSKYWNSNGGKTPPELDIDDVEGIDLSKVDPGRLLEEISDIYKNTYSNAYPKDPTTGMSVAQPVWQERIKFIADRHKLPYPAGFTEEGDFRTRVEVDNRQPETMQRGGKVIGIEKYNDQSVPVYSGSWDDVYQKAREDYSVHGSPVVYWDGKPMSILSAKEVGAYAPSSDDADYVPYLPGKSKEEARKEFGDADISRYNKFINASDEDKVRMLEENRYNRALSEAGEKATAAQKEERSKIEENNKAFAEQEKRKEELSRLQQGMDNVRVAKPNIPVDYTNVEDELSYQEDLTQRKENFSDLINYSDYIDYDPEIQQIYGVPEFAVEAGDVNPEFLMKSDRLKNIPTMSDVAYNTMKENLSEKDFKKWYSGVLDEKKKLVEQDIKEVFEADLPNKKAYEADKAKKDAEWKAYQEGSILDKMNRNAEFAIGSPWRAAFAAVTDPIVNLIEDQNINAEDYIYDQIYGTNTVEESSPFRSSSQFGFGKDNVFDILSPLKPLYNATGSLMNVASGEGNLTDAANIGLGALEVLPYTKAPKAIIKGLKSFGKAKPTVPTTLPAPSFDALSPSIDVLSGSFKKGGMKKAQMGGLSKLLIEALGQGQKLAKKMNFSDFYKSANANPLKFSDDYMDAVLNLKNSPNVPNVDVDDYLKFVDNLMTGKPTDIAKSVDDVDAMISSGLVMDRLKNAGYSSDDILKNAVDLIGQKVNPFKDYRFDKLLPRGPYTKSPFTFGEGNQYLFKHTPQEKIGESLYKKDSQFFKPGSLMNPYKDQSAISKLPAEVRQRFYTKNPTSPQKLEMRGENFLQQFGPTLPQIMDGANPAQFLDVTRKTATLPINLNKYGGESYSKELPSFQRRGQVRLNLPTLSTGEKIGLGTGATLGLFSSFMNPSSNIIQNIKVKNTAQNICEDGTCPTASDDWRDYTTRANMELGYGEDPNRPGYFSGEEFATGNVGGALARTFGRTALGAGTGLLTGYGAQWLGNKLAPRVFAKPGRLFKQSGGEKAQKGKFLKTLGKYVDDMLGTTTKVADDVTYTPEQLSNYNYAVDMGVPGVKKQNPGNLDEFLSGSFNKMPVYRTVDLNTDVIKQQSVIDDMVSKGFNPDDKLDIASYMGTNTPLEILQDFNKGRRSIHSDVLEGSGKDLLYTSDNPDWLIPNYGGSDPYMVKMFLDEKPATVIDQINALSTKFRKPVNDAVGLTSVPQYNLLGTNPMSIGDVPSGALVDNLYKGGNKIYPILGDFGQQLRQPVRVASGDDFFKIRARGEEFQQGGGVYDFSPFGPSSGFSGGKPVFDMNQNDLFPEPFIQKELPEDPPQEETQDDLLNFNLPNQDLVSPYTNTNIGTSTTPSTTTTDESQQITRERIPGSGIYRTLMSPGMGIFTETSDALRGVSSAVNDVYDNLNYQRAMNDQQRGTMADNLFTPTYVDENPISQGVYGVNTGYLGDILSGDGPSGYDSYRGMAKHGGEIELDTNTIAELIAAGADIEIL